ncbi:MAG: ATP-binding protein, partial [Candidatus Poribacteria bacterium]|nr:ATP-binding protein [Candidatus Poribacteria bacterium]
AVEGLRHLLDEFSQLARLPAPELTSLNLDDVVEATIDIFGEFPRHIDVRVDVPTDLPPVLGDAEHLKRAFLNLIKNGLEAMDGIEKGTLTIRVFPSADKSKVQVHFADTGRGIPPDVREKIFTPHVSTKRDGMGLGLAIVKKIMTDLGGDIRLEDAQPGQSGTTFVLWLRTSVSD